MDAYGGLARGLEPTTGARMRRAAPSPQQTRRDGDAVALPTTTKWTYGGAR